MEDSSLLPGTHSVNAPKGNATEPTTESNDVTCDLDQTSLDAPGKGSNTKEAEGPGKQLQRTQPCPGTISRRGVIKDPLTLEAAAVHLFAAGAGWLALRFMRLFKRQQKRLGSAASQLHEAQRQLCEREEELQRIQSELERARSAKAEQEQAARQLSSQFAEAQQELVLASERCRAAAEQLDKTMCDLSSTEAELHAARSQLASASADLHSTTARLEASEGELGLTRSENELMKRELETLRRQLRDAGHQLEGYMLVASRRRDAAADRDNGAYASWD